MRVTPLAVTTSILSMIACATVIPPARPLPPQDHYIQAPFDSVWQRTVGFFADSRIPIRTIDKESGIIASSSFELPFDQAQTWADCGKASTGEPTLARLQAINNIPQIQADFNVFIRKAGDSSAVRVNLGLTGSANSPAGKVPLQCVTNGKFEEALVNYVTATSR
jgi:hypothetical protein